MRTYLAGSVTRCIAFFTHKYVFSTRKTSLRERGLQRLCPCQTHKAHRVTIPVSYNLHHYHPRIGIQHSINQHYHHSRIVVPALSSPPHHYRLAALVLQRLRPRRAHRQLLPNAHSPCRQHNSASTTLLPLWKETRLLRNPRVRLDVHRAKCARLCATPRSHLLWSHIMRSHLTARLQRKGRRAVGRAGARPALSSRYEIHI